MAFRLRADQAVGAEVRRLFEAELDAAIDGLRSRASDIHDVRKHVKKARALLFARYGGEPWRAGDADRELQVANRSLGPLADARRAVETAGLLEGFDRALLPDPVFDQLRSALSRRARACEADADRQWTRRRASRLLLSARQRASAWTDGVPDRAMLIAAIRSAHHTAADIRKLVRDEPTIAAYHRWRRRVKLEWYLVRLITDHTGDRLRDDRHRLAALDACLGELHDLNVLAAVLAAEPLLDRRDAARALRVVRALAADRRRYAGELSVVLKDRPRDVARRVEALWGIGPRVKKEPACLATA